MTETELSLVCMFEIFAKEKLGGEEFKHRMKVIGDDDHDRNTTLAQKKFQGVGPVGGNAARGKPKKATRVV